MGPPREDGPLTRWGAALALVAALGGVLIFANLDDRYLWEDEAETALLAQRVLRFGVPIAWDGRDLISQECGADYDANYLWRQTPWLPLRAEAKPGERVFVSYGDLLLRFYTDLEIRGGQGCQTLAGWPLPDRIVIRYFSRFRPSGPRARDDAERTLRYLRTEIPPERYRRVDLPVADTIWENVLEPDRHVFRAPANRPPVILYRKVSGR